MTKDITLNSNMLRSSAASLVITNRAIKFLYVSVSFLLPFCLIQKDSWRRPEDASENKNKLNAIPVKKVRQYFVENIKIILILWMYLLYS